MNSNFIKDDLLASIVVFFFAVSFCLGIAIAAGVPPLSGLIAGTIGGIVVGLLSKSQVNISGPTAGLVAIIIGGISTTGSMETFLVAVVIAGCIQIALGLLKAGTIGYFFPSNVIKGMLVAVGLIIIMKQIPHLLGYDVNYEGDLSFLHLSNGENTISAIWNAFQSLHLGATITGVLSLCAMVLWDYFKYGFCKIIPGALLCVLVGLVSNQLFILLEWNHYIISSNHLIQIPIIENLNAIPSLMTFPDFNKINNVSVWTLGFTIAFIASFETLLTIKATDKIDPLKRVTPTNRELLAQGAGNCVSGLIGGIPITSVIIRSAANIDAGGKTKKATVFHGFLLLAVTLTCANLLNLIPLTSLAAILLVTGWKLSNPKVFQSMFKLTIYEWLPFIITFVAILFSNLLVGVGIGTFVSMMFILLKNLRTIHYLKRENINNEPHIIIVLPQEVSFLKKASMLITLDRIPKGSNIVIDASHTSYIDYDVLEIVKEFSKFKAPEKNIKVIMKGFKEEYGIKNSYNTPFKST